VRRLELRRAGMPQPMPCQPSYARFSGTKMSPSPRKSAPFSPVAMPPIPCSRQSTDQIRSDPAKTNEAVTSLHCRPGSPRPHRGTLEPMDCPPTPRIVKTTSHCRRGTVCATGPNPIPTLINSPLSGGGQATRGRATTHDPSWCLGDVYHLMNLVPHDPGLDS
jgi:hypothetical protein